MRLLVNVTPIDPALGLAIEEALLNSARHDGCETTRIWINERAVILGRSQATAIEVDEAQAGVLRIPILRRISGGGTVYHYPGNLNVSIVLRKKPELSEVSSVFRFFGDVLMRALADLTPGLFSADNGLYVDGMKVGGAAQAHRGGVLLYHTTLLVRSPLIPMERLLLAMRPGYRSEGVASRPRTTTSLATHISRPLEPGEVVEPILDALASSLGVQLETGRLTPREEAYAAVLRKEKYGSPVWNQKL